MNFQHSQPQSVYRSKNYLVGWLQVATQLGLAGFYAFWSFDRPSIWSMLAIPLFLGAAVFFGRRNQREKLILSPAGISVTSGRSAATPWSNVERIQLIRPWNKEQLNAVPCLILREPPAGNLAPPPGLPAELKGRIIPLYIHLWQHIGQLQQELNGYLPATASDQDQLSVPVDLAAMDRDQQRSMVWIIAVPMLIIAIVMLLYWFKP